MKRVKVVTFPSFNSLSSTLTFYSKIDYLVTSLTNPSPTKAKSPFTKRTLIPYELVLIISKYSIFVPFWSKKHDILFINNCSHYTIIQKDGNSICLNNPNEMYSLQMKILSRYAILMFGVIEVADEDYPYTINDPLNVFQRNKSIYMTNEFIHDNSFETDGYLTFDGQMRFGEKLEFMKNDVLFIEVINHEIKFKYNNKIMENIEVKLNSEHKFAIGIWHCTKIKVF